jgi:integrase
LYRPTDEDLNVYEEQLLPLCSGFPEKERAEAQRQRLLSDIRPAPVNFVHRLFGFRVDVREPWRTMVQIAQSLGLRVSEIAALQWDDFDFDKHQFLVQRSFMNGRVDDVKTEYSQD